MDQDIDDMIAAYIKLVELIVERKGDMRHRSGAYFTVKGCVSEVVPAYFPHENRRVLPDRSFIIKMKTAV